MPRPNQGAVFLDRDGVINEVIFHQEMGLLESPFTAAQFRLLPRVGPAIRQIRRMGLKAVVVSNQPGVAMRHFSKQTLAAVTKKMSRLLARSGASLDGIYYCPHHPLKGKGALKRRCACRKPKPGLIRQAARDLAVDLKRSYLVGDSILDVQAGLRAGLTTFLTAHLRCDLCRLMARRRIKPHFVVKDLAAAVRKIAELERKRKV
jgi:histidinol-phosphate phosphatase family protein